MGHYFVRFNIKGDEKVRWIFAAFNLILVIIFVVLLTNDYFDKFEWTQTVLPIIGFALILDTIVMIMYLTRDKGDIDGYQ